MTYLICRPSRCDFQGTPQLIRGWRTNINVFVVLKPVFSMIIILFIDHLIWQKNDECFEAFILSMLYWKLFGARCCFCPKAKFPYKVVVSVPICDGSSDTYLDCWHDHLLFTCIIGIIDQERVATSVLGGLLLTRACARGPFPGRWRTLYLGKVPIVFISEPWISLKHRG